ncbi:MAG TPA: helix-turn-helix domain-containing protein [Lutibacter sp.]
MLKLNFDSLPQVVQELNEKIDHITKLLESPKQVENTNQLLTVQDAANFLNLSVSTIYNKVNKRELPAMKKGRRLYFSRTELLNYIKSGKILSIVEIEGQAKNYIAYNTKK